MIAYLNRKRSIKYKKERKPSCPYFSIPFLGGNKFFRFPWIAVLTGFFSMKPICPSLLSYTRFKSMLWFKKKLETYNATCLILMKEKTFTLTQVSVTMCKNQFFYQDFL